MTSPAEVVTKGESGDYTLTPLGTELGAALRPLDDWSRRWAEEHPLPERP